MSCHALNRHDVVTWLRREGFTEKPRGSSGHMHFEHPSTGIKIVVPGHGPTDLTKHVAGCIVRSLVKAGYPRDRVKYELRTGDRSC